MTSSEQAQPSRAVSTKNTDSPVEICDASVLISINFLPKSITQVSSNETSYKLNKFHIISIYIILSILTGPFFLNWLASQKMYLKLEAYSWLCESNNSVNGYCVQQVDAVNLMLTAGVASIFAAAFFGGVLFDIFGPKISALIGMSSLLSGWILLYFCHENLPLNVIAAALMGLGSDPILLSLLNGSRMFSKHHVAVLGIVESSRSISFAFPLWISYALDLGGDKDIIILIITVVLFGCLVTALIFVPWNRFRLLPVNSESSIESIWPPGSINQEPFYKSRNSDESFATQPTSVGTSCLSIASGADGEGYKVSKNLRFSRAIPNPCSSFDTKEGEYRTPDIEGSSPVNPSGLANLTTAVLREPGQFYPLFPLAALTIFSAAFYSNSSHNQLTPGALNLFIHLSPLAFIPGVALSILADRRGPLAAMFVVNILTFLQFACLLLSELHYFFQFPAVCFGCAVLSFFLAQFHCFIAANFPEKQFGRLSGILVMFTGAVGLVATPMCDFLSFEGNFIAVNSLCAVGAATNFIFLRLLQKAGRQQENS